MTAALILFASGGWFVYDDVNAEVIDSGSDWQTNAVARTFRAAGAPVYLALPEEQALPLLAASFGTTVDALEAEANACDEEGDE
jgi:hypothetical protein